MWEYISAAIQRTTSVFTCRHDAAAVPTEVQPCHLSLSLTSPGRLDMSHGAHLTHHAPQTFTNFLFAPSAAVIGRKAREADFFLTSFHHLLRV